ncbi:MAG: GHKL domain-containing protein [Clostridia bacterium]|nr:GHKL domain-containing protein [Clostridia bacterium]
MIAKHRFRFVALSTLALLVAMLIIISAVIGLSSLRLDRQYDAMLEVLLGNNGRLPPKMMDADGRISLSENPELIYETRYFTVRVAADGSVISEDLSHIATMRPETVRRAVDRAAQAGRDNGNFRLEGGHYAFARKAGADETMYVFIDITSRLWILREVLWYMTIVGIAILIVYVFVFLYYSKKIIQPQVEAMERQQRFITNASHELKTPLAVISANTEMMEMLHGRDKWTESTLRQVERMSGLTQRLVTLCRMEENGQEALTDVDMSRLTAEESGNYEQVILRGGKAFSAKIQEGVLVKGEEKAMRELLGILLDNAAKYCDEGGRVELSLTGGRHPALAVSNTFSEAAHVDTSRFFERFYREGGSRNSKKKGYGIGLSIAGDIAARMGGHIATEARNGCIRFTVTMRPGQKMTYPA